MRVLKGTNETEHFLQKNTILVSCYLNITRLNRWHGSSNLDATTRLYKSSSKLRVKFIIVVDVHVLMTLKQLKSYISISDAFSLEFLFLSLWYNLRKVMRNVYFLKHYLPYILTAPTHRVVRCYWLFLPLSKAYDAIVFGEICKISSFIIQIRAPNVYKFRL